MERRNGSGAAFAATWQNEKGETVGLTFGGTVCWFPKLPGRLRIAREDFEHIVRCGECPGCLELDRRRLADRLVAKYSASTPVASGRTRSATESRASSDAPDSKRLFLVRIYVPLEQQAKLAHRLHRIRRLGLEAGFWRLGTSSMAVLARSIAEIPRWLRGHGIVHRTAPLKLRRGRRAFGSLTAGLLIPRAAYGEQLNRWYAKGLPALEREKWEVMKREYEKGYQRATSPRAWKSGRLILVPPEAWRLKRVDRRTLRRALSAVSSPEQVRQVAELVAALGSARSMDPLLADHPRSIPSREQMAEYYKQRRERAGHRAASGATDDSSLSPSKGGAYVSSEHTTDARAGPILSDAELLEPGASGKPRWQERVNEDLRKWTESKQARAVELKRDIAAWLERMKAKAKGEK